MNCFLPFLKKEFRIVGRNISKRCMLFGKLCYWMNEHIMEARFRHMRSCLSIILILKDGCSFLLKRLINYLRGKKQKKQNGEQKRWQNYLKVRLSITKNKVSKICFNDFRNEFGMYGIKPMFSRAYIIQKPDCHGKFT